MTENIIQLLQDGYKAQCAGDRVRAEQIYREALRLNPDNVHALHLLGVLCAESARPQEAIDRLSRALRVGGENAQAHACLGLAHMELGQRDEAERHLRRSIQLEPHNAVVLNDLGNVLRQLERQAEAIASYEAAVRLQPNWAECWSNLAAAHNESNNYERGLMAIDCALKLEPRMAQAWSNKGDLLLSASRYDEAIVCYRRSLELDPGNTAALVNIALAQKDSDDPQAALATLRTALELEPANSRALYVMGILHEQLGDRDVAADMLHAATRIAPDMAVAHYALAQIEGRRVADEELAAMTALWERNELLPSDRSQLAYALYRAFEQRSEYDKAFSFLEAGSRIRASANPYDDTRAAHYMYGAVIATETAMARCGHDSGEADPRPIFVLGMPRSGTSLTEQILASHSEVAGAGEVTYVYDMLGRIRDLTGKSFPHGLAALTAHQLGELGRYYMSRHSPANLAHRFVVDKTPFNYQYIGPLALALPRARFIHCHRDPVANCFAIHRLPFDPRQTFAHDLAALGRYYCRYWNLMNRWQALFPGRILDVRYEDTVSDIDRQSRRMLQFLGLPFEEDVLRYYATERLVKTPSTGQVRRPIYADSIDSWKKYQRHLGPLIESLRPVLGNTD
jgi:tetratricopeptide (TPR) repeat protein